MEANGSLCRINEIVSQLLDEKSSAFAWSKYSIMVAITILFESGQLLHIGGGAYRYIYNLLVTFWLRIKPLSRKMGKSKR